jgi:sigma-B regulation protein RsbU (phosphoserine phosphatase)
VISLKNQVKSVKELLTKINDVLYQQMEKQMFITMSAVKIEDEKGNISLARAGHMPFLIKKDKDIEVLRPNGIGLGLTSSNLFDSTLEEINYKLNNNENLIMYSDGAVEIFKDGKEIDSDFLKQIINKSVYKNSGDLIDNIVKEIEKLKENHTIVDDMTLVCITYNNGENNG